MRRCGSRARRSRWRSRGRKEPCCIHLARGPVGAAAAAARRIGWRHIKGSLWQDFAGVEIDLENDSPAWVKQRAENDAEQCMWRRAAARHAHLAHLDGAPHMEAAAEMLEEHSSQGGRLDFFVPSWQGLFSGSLSASAASPSATLWLGGSTSPGSAPPPSHAGSQ